jgi:hypothetical protein
MRLRDRQIFKEAVRRYFAPRVAKAKLAIREITGELYEIQSKEFTVRLRQGIGHGKDILVTLFPTAERSADVDDLSGEIGLNKVAEFSGTWLPDYRNSSDEEYFKSVEKIAGWTEEFAFPFLLGQRSDFARLHDFVFQQNENVLKETPEGEFPKNVRREWI